MANKNEQDSRQTALGIDRPADVVVVGGGLAGLAGALTLVRARRSVLVIDAGHPRNAPAVHEHGYLTRDGTPPLDLLTAGRAEVAGYGGLVIPGTVTAVKRLSDGGLEEARHALLDELGVTIAETGTAGTFKAGVDLKKVIGINLSAQSGYNKQVSITYTAPSEGGYMCGSNNYPSVSAWDILSPCNTQAVCVGASSTASIRARARSRGASRPGGRTSRSR